MSIALARKRALPAIIVLLLFAIARIGAGVWMSRKLELAFSTVVLAYGISAIVYAVLAYGVFRLWRWASLASIAYFWWQVQASPQSLTQLAIVLSIVTAILTTGVVASFKYHSSVAEKREDARDEE